MKKNMGTVDRGFRVALAIIVVMLYFTGKISGTLAIVLGIIALVFVLTSLVGFCPAYTPFGIRTFRHRR